MIVCGTGHRPDKFPWYDRKKTDAENEQSEECLWIKEQIKNIIARIISEAPNEESFTFISGMALGYDM